MLLAGQGGDHLTSSMIYHSSTVTCIPTAIVGGSTACFASNVCVTGNADTAAGLVINNGSGASGTCQHYINFTAGATVISRMFRGNGVSGVAGGGLTIDNFDGMNIRLNQLGGSGGFLGISGGTACFSNAVCVGANLVVRSAATFCDTVGLFGGSSQLYIGATSNASDFAVLGWCSTNRSLNIQNQSTGTGPQLIIACDGKVGVAVRDPIVQLHVRTTVASESRPTTLATSATNSAAFITTIAGSSAGIAFGQLGSNTNYIQATYENGGACTPLALNPYGGNVGIGTGNTALSYSLDVNGAGRIALNLRVGGAGYSVGNENDPAITNAVYTNAGIYFACCGIGLGVGTSKYLFMNSTGTISYNNPDTNSGTYLTFNKNITAAVGRYAQIKIGHPSYGGYIGNLLTGPDVMYLSMCDNPNACRGVYIDSNGYLGIRNSTPNAPLEVGSTCGDTTAGGLLFKSLELADNTWTTFFTPPANWAGLTTLNWVGTNDHNRSGAAQIRWSYQPCAAQLGPTTTIFNDSQNATGYFRYSGGNMQICVDGAGAGKRLQILIQGSRGA
jgi:hypothetical protein